jgi:prepilin-type N-terminal cleavage/methylation domain-containing protein
VESRETVDSDLTYITSFKHRKRREIMKNLKKKNNKGFSLVELIVVVMIMAILAVALAPQVMKWVGNSRVAADVNTYEAMVSSVQLALAKESVYTALTPTAAAPSTDVVATVKIYEANQAASGDPVVYVVVDNTALDGELVSILGTDYKNKTRAKVSGEDYTITITNGKVSKTDAPNGSSVK